MNDEMGEGSAAPKWPAEATRLRRLRADAALVLEDGSVFWGRGAGAVGVAVGEVCFNTAITGYQEVLTDPSYAGQIITFTFPHVGNVGANPEDIETLTPAARGCVLRVPITEPSNWRAARHFRNGLQQRPGRDHHVDTRRLTRRIRDGGAPRGALIHSPGETIEVAALRFMAERWPGLEGMDLAKEVMCRQTYTWDESGWTLGRGYGRQTQSRWNVVAVDYGAKRNILRCLAAAGCRVTVVPGTATAEDVLRHQAGRRVSLERPGRSRRHRRLRRADDPRTAGAPDAGVRHLPRPPDAGPGAGRQDLQAAPRPPRRQPSGKDLETGRVEITSQNHGFAVDRATLPAGVIETHVSLFDNTNEGLRVEDAPAFSVQYHPEASPGPQDSHYLFHRFTEMMSKAASTLRPRRERRPRVGGRLSVWILTS